VFGAGVTARAVGGVVWGTVTRVGGRGAVVAGEAAFT
jgi:hypothetical protein